MVMRALEQIIWNNKPDTEASEAGFIKQTILLDIEKNHVWLNSYSTYFKIKCQESLSYQAFTSYY